jgi:pimeloyl-ACP methyl ester carboxylesterase
MTAQSEARYLSTRDGRRLCYAEYGHSKGKPIIVFHGLPGSRLQRHPDESIAVQAGARTIHFERPGFGCSDPQPGRGLVHWVRDVMTGTELLGLDRFAIAGISGGGPYALACAAFLGHRITRVAIVSGVGPSGSMSDRSMHLTARLGFALAARAPWLLRGGVAASAKFATAHPERYLDITSSSMAPRDRAILARPEVREMFAEDLREAFRQGTRGLLDDLGLIARPWQLPLAAATCPIAIWQGKEDTVVPASAAQRLADLLPGATLNLHAGEGHLLMLDRWPEILGWLVR